MARVHLNTARSRHQTHIILSDNGLRGPFRTRGTSRNEQERQGLRTSEQPNTEFGCQDAKLEVPRTHNFVRKGLQKCVGEYNAIVYRVALSREKICPSLYQNEREGDIRVPAPVHRTLADR